MLEPPEPAAALPASRSSSKLSQLQDPNKESDVASPGLSAPLLVEAAAIENRLRHHVLELIEPTIKKQSLQDVRSREAKAAFDNLASEVAVIKRSVEGSESLRGMVETFRQELADWDRQRKEHEQLVGDRASLHEIELNELRRGIDRKGAELTATNRVLKSLGDSVTTARDEISELRTHCEHRLDLGRDKIAKLRDEFETRVMAVESDQHCLRDHHSSVDAQIRHIKIELETMQRDVEANVNSITDLWRMKVDVNLVEEQQQEFSEFARGVDAHVSGLGQQFGSLVDEVKAHFQTAAHVVGTSTAQQMDEMRAKYKEDVNRVDVVLAEMKEFMATQQGLEASLHDSISKVVEEDHRARETLRDCVDTSLKKRESDYQNFLIELGQLRRSVRILEANREKDCGFGAPIAASPSGNTPASGGGGGGGSVKRDILSMMVESMLLGATLEMQDDQDRKSISLFGFKAGDDRGMSQTQSCRLPDLQSTGHCTPRMGPTGKNSSPRKLRTSMASTFCSDGAGQETRAPPVVTLDKRCLSCSGSAATVMAGFKLACLQYAPTPVEYQKVKYSRSELIRLRIDLLNQVKEQLRALD
mmetsp:Transcript_30352/g.77185  ORF Transcript_30352/g.77185 Transcript_30352/m.77185 type:complete len:588 (-) Transcript_30352:45-1808(-)